MQENFIHFLSKSFQVLTVAGVCNMPAGIKHHVFGHLPKNCMPGYWKFQVSHLPTQLSQQFFPLKPPFSIQEKEKCKNGNASGLSWNWMTVVYLFRSSYGFYHLVLEVSTKCLRILIGLTISSRYRDYSSQRSNLLGCSSGIWNVWQCQKHRLSLWFQTAPFPITKL